MVFFSRFSSFGLFYFFANEATAIPLVTRAQDASVTPCTSSSAKCVPYMKSYTGPLLDNFILGDPSALKVDENTFYVYATEHSKTNTNVPYAKSTTGLHGIWMASTGDAMPRMAPYGTGAWSLHPNGDSQVWNPDVSKLNSTHYIIYYSAKSAPASGESSDKTPRCIGVGYSTSPDGPFKARDEYFTCGPKDGGGAIGVDGIIDNSSNPPRRFVLFKDGSYPKGGKLSHLALQEVDPSDGFTMIGDLHLLTTQQEKSPGEESPALAIMPNNKWVLLHTEGTWHEDYTTVYATSKTKDITGDYEDLHLASTLLAGGANPGLGPTMYKPGGPDFLDNSNQFIFAATKTQDGTARHIYSAEIGYKEA